MTNTSIPLPRVLALNTPLAWYEAVAIAVACAERISASGVAAGLDTCTIATDGAADVTGSSRVPFDGDPLLRLVTLLINRQDAPRELTSLLQRWETPDHGSPESLRQELAYFSRPDSVALIAAVAVRAMAKESEAAATAEFARLREGASAPRPAQATASRRRFPWRRATVAAVGVGASVAIATALSRVQLPSSTVVAESAPVAAVTRKIDALIDRGLQSLGVSTSAEPAASEPHRIALPPPKRPVSTPSEAVPAITARFIGHANAVTAPPQQDIAPTDSSGAVPVDTGEDTSRHAAAPEVYSPSDPDVQPPVLTRAQFRRTETSDTVAMSTVEVLVDEFGTVERVRLQSRRTSLHDRMLISAIKAWRFRPALRAGTPVRYTLRMAVPREETR
jgi:hypothetical protein